MEVNTQQRLAHKKMEWDCKSKTNCTCSAIVEFVHQACVQQPQALYNLVWGLDYDE